jgi:hypothetical protein
MPADAPAGSESGFNAGGTDHNRLLANNRGKRRGSHASPVGRGGHRKRPASLREHDQLADALPVGQRGGEVDRHLTTARDHRAILHSPEVNGRGHPLLCHLLHELAAKLHDGIGLGELLPQQPTVGGIGDESGNAGERGTDRHVVCG